MHFDYAGLTEFNFWFRAVGCLIFAALLCHFALAYQDFRKDEAKAKAWMKEYKEKQKGEQDGSY